MVKLHMYRRCLMVASRGTYLSKMSFSTTSINMKQKYKFVIAGGGTGGITMASKILRLGEKDVAVIEPSTMHYYQPYWTLVGGRKKNLASSGRAMELVMPEKARWIKDKVMAFNPSSNTVITETSGAIEYEYLIVALGIELAFHKVKGLPEALKTKGVCSNYSVHTVQKTAVELADFVEGNVIFTQPVNPIKCAGAPQKIAYLADEYFRKNGNRLGANIMFNTALPTIFACKHYADVLKIVAAQKNIAVNYEHNLIEVKADSKQAVFDKLDSKGSSVGTEVFEYEFLHVTPPMVAPQSIRESPLASSTGFMDVNQNTLQASKFDNVFGIGDCINVPTSKTAAAVAAQCGVLTKNLKSALKGNVLTNMYYGYTSCPLVTGYSKGILAEFNYEMLPEETLPIDQSKERFSSFFMKKEVLPYIYWNLMLKGLWSGPKFLRKLTHLGMTN